MPRSSIESGKVAQPSELLTDVVIVPSSPCISLFDLANSRFLTIRERGKNFGLTKPNAERTVCLYAEASLTGKLAELTRKPSISMTHLLKQTQSN
jgi:hypothetical protein